MNEEQISKAMNLLARLYAEQIGMKNPTILIRSTKDEEENA